MAVLVPAAMAADGLAIVQPVIAQYDGGPAVPAGTGFTSGETVFLAFDVSGFKPTREDEPKVHLKWTAQPFDAQGVALTEPRAGEVAVQLEPEDKNWRPRARTDFLMPQGLLDAAAEVRLQVSDEIAKGKATLVVPFRTRGLALPAGAPLQALRFRFLRSEDAREPLTVAAYKSGDTLWAQFEIAGYKLAEANEFRVSYGLEVFRANGQSLYKQEEAAAESGKSFYPRRYVTGGLSLQLTKGLDPGEYTIALRLKDLIGDQAVESKHVFRVE